MNKDMYILLRSNTIYTYIYKYRYREREKNSPTHPKLQNCSRPAHVDPATGGVVTEDVPPLPPPPPPEWGWGQGWLERGKLEFLEDDFPELEICFLDLRCFEFKMHRSWIVGLSKNHHEDSVTSFITSVFFLNGGRWIQILSHGIFQYVSVQKVPNQQGGSLSVLVGRDPALGRNSWWPEWWPAPGEGGDLM